MRRGGGGGEVEEEEAVEEAEEMDRPEGEPLPKAAMSQSAAFFYALLAHTRPPLVAVLI